LRFERSRAPPLRDGVRLDTALIAGVPRKLLGGKVISLANRSVDIGAVDFLVSGI
jgi:hypothetical protein